MEQRDRYVVAQRRDRAITAIAEPWKGGEDRDRLFMPVQRAEVLSVGRNRESCEAVVVAVNPVETPDAAVRTAGEKQRLLRLLEVADDARAALQELRGLAVERPASVDGGVLRC